MITGILGACAVLQIVAGISVGASTELGTLHICFGLYIALDVWKTLASKKVNP